MRSQSRTREGLLADRQHGLVTREQLLDAGLSAAAVQRRVRSGVLLPVFRGVYRVGHRAWSVEAHYLAAVLACGDRSVLSGLAAAHLLRLTRASPPPPEVSSLDDRKPPGVLTHRVRTLDRSKYRGVPVTTVPRTLADLAPRLPLDDLAEACHHAEVLHHVRRAPFDRPGGWKLQAILEGDHPTVLSRLESRFLEALRSDGLPVPHTNRPEGAHYVDCRWPDHRLTVELDSYRFHHSRHAWEQDRQRERAARARGDEFRRYTWRDVAEEPVPMLADLRRLLALRR